MKILVDIPKGTECFGCQFLKNSYSECHLFGKALHTNPTGDRIKCEQCVMQPEVVDWRYK